MGKLTDVQLREWVKAGLPIAGKSDGEGLTFTMSRKGAAAWVFRYRYAGRQRELTLGTYPGLSLKDARNKAADARSRVNDGTDVAAEKQRQRNSLLSSGLFRDLAYHYVEKVGPGLAETTMRETGRYMAKDLLPRIGGRPVGEINGADVVSLIKKVAERSPSVARRCFELLSVLFAHGMANQIIHTNPCAGIKVSAVIGERKPTRERIKLTREELARLLTRLSGTSLQNGLAIRILLVTCTRKGELINAQWNHVDLEAGTWTIPPENSKNGKGFVIPLPAHVTLLFHELKKMAGRSAYVLPTRAGKSSREDKPISHNTLNLAINRLGMEDRHFSPHDLRSTARSYLAELGVNVIVAERCLNHELGGLVGVYDQHDYMEERRHALDLWASFLARIERGEPWNVISIKRPAA